MPIKKAAEKYMRQTKRHLANNNHTKGRIELLIRSTERAIETKDKTKITESLKQTIQALDKAVQKGILKRNTVGRRKSQITTAANKALA